MLRRFLTYFVFPRPPSQKGDAGGLLAIGVIGIILCWFVMLAPGLAMAGAAKVAIVAILEFDAEEVGGHVDTRELAPQLRLVAAENLKSETYPVLEQETMDELVPFDERRLCLSGVCVAEVGRRLQARYVVSGKLTGEASDLVLTLELVGTRGDGLLALEQCSGASMAELSREAETAMLRLFATLPGSALRIKKSLSQTQTLEAPQLPPPAAGGIMPPALLSLPGDPPHRGTSDPSTSGGGVGSSPATPSVTATESPVFAITNKTSDGREFSVEKTDLRTLTRPQRTLKRMGIGGAAVGLAAIGGSFAAAKQANSAIETYESLTVGTSESEFTTQYKTANLWRNMANSARIIGPTLTLVGGVSFYFGGR